MPTVSDPVRLAGNRYGGLLRTGTPAQQYEAKQHLESLRLERAINEALQAGLSNDERTRLGLLLLSGGA